MKKATFPSMASPLKSYLYGNGGREMSFGRPVPASRFYLLL